MNTNDKIIKPKLGLLKLAKHPGNVSAACAAMGYSRDSYDLRSSMIKEES
jgi:hypothetical protein